MPDPDDLLTAPAVARILHVSGETVRRWAAGGRIAFVLLPSGQRRFRRSDVEAILAPVDPVEAAS